MDRFGPFQWTNLLLDRTTHWTAWYSKFPGRVKNKGLKMYQSGPFQWTYLQLDWTTDWTFFSGPDNTLDRFFLDQTTHWTAWYSKCPGRVKNKGLKMDRSGPFQWTNLQLDQTTDWTTFSRSDHTLDHPIFQISWEGQKQGLKNGPVRSISVDQFATGPDHRLENIFLGFFWNDKVGSLIN